MLRQNARVLSRAVVLFCYTSWFVQDCKSFAYSSLEWHVAIQCMNLHLLYAFSKLNFIPIFSAL